MVTKCPVTHSSSCLQLELSPALAPAVQDVGLATQLACSKVPPSLLAPIPHESSPECALGHVLVVCAAAESNALDGRHSPARDFMDVIEFQEASFRASAATGSHECALIAVSESHSAADRGRDGSGVS